ncbi:MAG TPA: molybdate ABC transporter substrate-binding protein [Planctomycetaceae bacterium]|nr:molybdate ABC transporter substrate-binding protein [Planctomycetaceae bacterium]
MTPPTSLRDPRAQQTHPFSAPRPALLLLLTTALVGCLPGCADNGTAADRNTILVLAAASTADALREAADVFERDTGVRVRISSGPSNGLAQQILSGAPADIHISAAERWMTALDDAGFVAESRPFLSNRLVLAVPRGSPAALRTPDDLSADAVQRVALAGEDVPDGAYAEQALRSLGVFASLQSKRRLVRGHDVRAVLSYVERGEVDAGIVYASDARASQAVEVVHTFDPATHDAIIYPVGLLKSGADRAAARRFFEFLDTPRAAEVFRRHGLTPIPGGGRG